MKTIQKLLLVTFILLPIGFVGCSDDDQDGITPEPISKLEIEQESLKVKIGSENKTTINIKQGSGEYNAFSLNPDVAQVTIENSEIQIEGLKNGRTEVIVSDKDGSYRKLPVSVYTADALELDKESLEFITKIGYSDEATINVTKGNGGYSIASDNKAITTSITKEGVITIAGTSQLKEINAIITVTDCSGFTAHINVRFSGTTVPYNDTEIEKIKEADATCYYINENNTLNYSSFIPTQTVDENGRRMYGWKYSSSYYYYRLYFDGGVEPGVKTNAVLSCKTYNPIYTYTDEPVTVEIIKNNGTRIWAIYSFINNGKLVYGYFIDIIEEVSTQ